MTDSDRLQRVAQALAEAIDARARGKKVSLPVIQPADAAGLMGIMYAQLDDAIARRDAQIGARMACHKGCSSCCTSTVLVTEGEAVAIAEWLRLPENADARTRFDAAYAAWSEQLGDLLVQDERDADANQAWMRSVPQRHVMCAFNVEGACTVYPVRPGICRKTHALELVPKKAAGTAAGFTGFFGYAFGSAIAGSGVGWIADHWDWGGVFIAMIACCMLTMGFIALTLKAGATPPK